MLTILVTVLVAILVAGLLYWLLTFLPLPAPFQQLALGVIVIGLVLFIVVELWSARGLVAHR